MMVVGAGALGLTTASAATLALLIHAAQILLGLLCAGLTVALPGQQGTSPGPGGGRAVTPTAWR
jgi:hypothetical protein